MDESQMRKFKRLQKTSWLRRTIFLALIVSGCTSEAPTFDSVLNQHLDAIAQRDLSAYVSTLTLGRELPIVFPDGSRTLTREQAIEFHRSWFADSQWRMDIEEMWRRETSSYAVVLLETAYRDTASGEPRFGWLSLSFAKEGGSWRLVFDQNTRIPSK